MQFKLIRINDIINLGVTMKKIDKSLIYTIVIFIFINIVYYIAFKSFIPCLIHKITGLYCPGCGISRMLISIVKLDFYQAFRYNPFLFILLIVSLIYQVIKLITYKLLTIEIKLNNKVYVSLLVLTILFGIIRNLPQFSYLIPTVVK